MATPVVRCTINRLRRLLARADACKGMTLLFAALHESASVKGFRRRPSRSLTTEQAANRVAIDGF